MLLSARCRGLYLKGTRLRYLNARICVQCASTASTARASQPAKSVEATHRKSGARPTPPRPKSFQGENGRDSAGSPQPASFTGARRGAPLPPAPDTKEYPSNLLIYHGGTGIALFIMTFKLAAILIFIFSTFAIAPGYYYSTFEPTWMAPVVIATGALPMTLMVFIAPPYVTYIHLALPRWARLSQTRLLHFSQNLPSTAVVELTAVRWLWPRVSRLHASELYLKNHAGISYTLRRSVPPEVYSSRKWYGWRPVKSFLVAGRSGKVVENDVWPEVLNAIHRGWRKNLNVNPTFSKSG